VGRGLRALLPSVALLRGFRLRLRSLALLLRIPGLLLPLRPRILILCGRLLRGVAGLVALLRILLLAVLILAVLLLAILTGLRLLLLLLLEQLRDEVAIEARVGVIGHGRERLVVGGERVFEATCARERVAEVVAGLRTLLICERLGRARVVLRAIE